MREIRTVLVVGAGVMGHGIAQLFASRGRQVVLVDQSKAFLERAMNWIRVSLDYMAELEEIERAQVERTMSRIHLSTILAQFARQADFVLEAVTEDLELKKQIFQELGRVTAPDVALATNTSTFDINELCAVTEHPNRVIGTHFFHPPPITPCVEIIPADATDEATIDHAIDFMEKMGKFPTICKCVPGFVANRIQNAMAAEALSIVEEGLATPEQVDRIVKSSFGLRLGAFGPLEIVDQAGLDTYRAVLDYLYTELGHEKFKPPAILDKMIAEGRLGLKTERGFYEYGDAAADELRRTRDRRLLARLRLFREENNLL